MTTRAVARCIGRSKAKPTERLWNRGNDYYLQCYPDKPSKFDALVTTIGLEGKPIEYLIDSQVLRYFAKENRHRYYVPEVLLLAWNLGIDEIEAKL